MSCLICDRIKQIKQNKNPYFVAELSTGYVVLGDLQYFKGYTLFLSKEHVNELHLHSKPAAYLNEVVKVGEAVYSAFKPMKLNYEILGNSDPHLHTHIFPRHATDPDPRRPVWVIDKTIRDSAVPSSEELVELVAALKLQL